MNEMKIAIQGIKGSFHHLVALNYFGPTVEVTECISFQEIIDKLSQKEAQRGVMALENSIAGSILPNYALIDDYDMHVIGEYNFSIDHNLMCYENQTLEDIKEVHSHPMALLQCKEFFNDYDRISLVEATDTAKVAQLISIEKLKGIAAIGSKEAAKTYNLNVLSESIQTINNNVTRFVILKNNLEPLGKKSYNKASLKFILDHQRGSLAAVLNVLSDCLLNLTKIQSLPVIKTPGKYAFFVDVKFKKTDFFQKAVSILKIMALEFKIIGQYSEHKN
tara:strand:+ start:1953 stop:2783 length:831 start_codon:yes stop_codon:yes gene_type:complete